jgi:hypothetical protein
MFNIYPGEAGDQLDKPVISGDFNLPNISRNNKLQDN